MRVNYDPHGRPPTASKYIHSIAWIVAWIICLGGMFALIFIATLALHFAGKAGV